MDRDFDDPHTSPEKLAGDFGANIEFLASQIETFKNSSADQLITGSLIGDADPEQYGRHPRQHP